MGGFPFLFNGHCIDTNIPGEGNEGPNKRGFRGGMELKRKDDLSVNLKAMCKFN
jgi:hypothetical protein